VLNYTTAGGPDRRQKGRNSVNKTGKRNEIRRSTLLLTEGAETMKTYGYARCSTNEDKQDINRQIRELKAAGADEVIFEYEHGDAKVKKNLYMLLEMAASGDTIITMEVSRLSRSTQQLCEILDIVKNKHLRLVIVGSITVDCRKGKIDPMSQAFIQMSGVFAELELSMIRDRVRSGMENAKAKGKKVGRPQTTKDNIPPIFYKHYPAFVAGTLNISEFARLCGMSRPTVYKYLRIIG
jgi:DNA invertase Pin-like site-specific DNA recombinase